MLCLRAGNMRGFGMGGQQFRQFFTAGNRSSLLGPVPMGMAIKSPIMGFPAARPFHPHPRYFNNNNTTTTSAASSASSSSSSMVFITAVLQLLCSLCGFSSDYHPSDQGWTVQRVFDYLCCKQCECMKNDKNQDFHLFSTNK